MGSALQGQCARQAGMGRLSLPLPRLTWWC